MRGERDEGAALAGALMGAAAGGIAVWVMDRVDWAMYDHEDPEARRRTQRVRPEGMDPAHLVANKIAAAFGQELSPRQPHPAGVAVHYALGIGPGALYGALHERTPSLGIGRGALFGLGLFLIQDEALNAATGLSARPGRYPWQAHARGLVAHVVYGVVMDTALRLMKGAAARNRREEQAWAARRPPAGMRPHERAPATELHGSARPGPAIRGNRDAMREHRL